MVTVVTTNITTEGPQIDGRRWVHLRHQLDDGTIEESDTLIDDSTTPIKLKNARVKAINERPVPPEPDLVLEKLDEAREAYLAGDTDGAADAATEAAEAAR